MVKYFNIALGVIIMLYGLHRVVFEFKFSLFVPYAFLGALFMIMGFFGLGI